MSMDDPLYYTQKELQHKLFDPTPCKRCGSVIQDREQHRAWHGSVDTAQTAELGRGK